METTKALVWSWLVACVSLGTALPATAQTPVVGALAIDERQGDQYGWAVDYETAAAARAAALRECGVGCSVVLTFARCGAYAADQDTDSTAVGWAESFDSAAGARQTALSECAARGGSGCTVRVWGCNGPVVEEGLGLNQAARRQIQLGLRAEGFDPGGADGLFGPRTRTAIRSWQSARGARLTGYLDGPQVEALRNRGGSQPSASAEAEAGQTEVVFWQSIQNSTNPVEFEAYLEQFPNGVFRVLAQARLGALRGSTSGSTTAAGQGVGGARTSASGARVSGTPVSVSGTAATPDARSSAVMFRPDQTCAGQPEGTACWMEVSQQPGCYVWDSAFLLGATVTWSGACAGGVAQGTGTLTWLWDGNRQMGTGRIVDGRRTGHWVARQPDGTVAEGPTADGAANGRWVWRYANGNVWEGPYVDGKMNGNWVGHLANGDVEERLYEDGDLVRSGVR